MKRITTLALALWCAAAAPAAAQNREHLQMAAELRMVQEQIQQLALTLAQLGDALKATNARIDESANQTRKSIADQGLAVKEMGDDLSAIRERTQDTDTRLRSLADEIEALRMTLLSLPSLLTQAAPAVTPPDPANPNAPPVVTPAPSVSLQLPSTAGLSPGRMYDTAWTDYTAGQYSLAISGFEQLIRTYPQSERADDAQFFIGEAHYVQNRWPEAIAAYNQVIQTYPKGDQAANAYYKRGLAQERSQQIDAARASYDQLIKTFPETSAATLAKQALDRLGRQAPAAPTRQ